MISLILATFFGMAPVTTPCDPNWSATKAYVKGDVASFNRANYEAKWWTQGNNPSCSNGPTGSGKPWIMTGPCVYVGESNATTVSPIVSPIPSTPLAQNSNVFYSAYKDVAISANWNTSVISTSVTGALVPLVSLSAQIPAITWAFATGECGQETWGGLKPDVLAAANVQAFAGNKKSYIISTGGASGQFTCSSDAGFTAFIERYYSAYLQGIDFDIEAGQSDATVDALIARVKTAQVNPRYAHLRFSFTVATLGGNEPQSLGAAGVQVASAIKKNGLTSYTINLMAMDYGSASPSNCMQASDGTCAMGLSAVQAAINLHVTYSIPYSQIELTPMIGGNDTSGETFTLNDADIVASFAKRYGLAGVHYWSLDRDKDCAPGYASPICNSYGQAGTLGYAQRFANGLN